MNLKEHKELLIILLLPLLYLPFHFFMSPASKGTLKDIKENGEITVIMTNNANVYYSYRDEYMGFEYDLVKKFAEFLDVKLKVVTPGWNDMFNALNSGKGDMIAAGVTITPPRKELADFSQGYLDVQQQVVVHKSNRSIKKIKDLSGEKIHIRSQTSYEERLKELQKNGLDIEIVYHKNVPTEELIQMVSEKKIRITVADSNIARLNQRYYPDIKIAFPISEPQSLGWAVRKNSNRLLKEINKFFDKIEKNGTFGQIYERYYRNVSIFDYVDIKRFHRRLETRLPKYKGIIKKAAEKHGFDWRLIAAMVYQESHFNPHARSYTGVRGLMQVTQRTAKEMGIKNRMNPEQNVKAGVAYLAKIFHRFDEIEDPNTKMLFALASYNVGYGHVRDAQNICRKKGWNPDTWGSMKKALPLLRVRKYYKNTKYGYARGTEAVRYVRRIITYYDIIKQKAHK